MTFSPLREAVIVRTLRTHAGRCHWHLASLEQFLPGWSRARGPR